MKTILIMLFSIAFLWLGATDPIKHRTFYVEVDLSYTFHQHYMQALFKKKGITYGAAISLGHRISPIYLEYNFTRPMTFRYGNNEIRDQFSEIGLRYNLNHLTYLIPHGIDPYLGAGLMLRKNQFTQHAVSGEGTLNSLSTASTTYKLSAGVKVGSRNLRMGLHYDYLPRGLDVPKAEGSPLRIYNSMHLFSLRLGVRLHAIPRNKVKCPRLNKRVKRTLKF